MSDILEEFNKRYQDRVGRFQGLDTMAPMSPEEESLTSGQIMAQTLGDKQRFGGFGSMQKAPMPRPIDKQEVMRGLPEKVDTIPTKKVESKKEESIMDKFRNALYRILTTPEQRKKHDKEKEEFKRQQEKDYQEFLIKQEMVNQGLGTHDEIFNN